MRAVRVRYTPRAIRDLDAIHSYIAKDNPAAATGVVARIRAAADTLELFPFLGHAGLVPNTLELVVVGLPYVIVYRVKDNEPEEVLILSIYHGRQQRG